ncbi:hypothetical protein ILUMI_25521, partial [Ignelater luminosus]
MADYANKINLDVLTSEDVFALLNEIPSDNESVTSGAPSKDNVDFDEEVVTIDKAFENETIEDQPQSNATEEDFDSEDEQPLSDCIKENTIWGKQVANNSQSILNFNSAFGPDIQDDIQYPVDNPTKHVSKNQSIDETMVKFKDRIGFWQCMPLKPIKRGYKIWAQADETEPGKETSSMILEQFRLAVASGLTGSINDAANKRKRKCSIEFSRFK